MENKAKKITDFTIKNKNMSIDSIADMFTCLRNTRKTTVIFPYSRFKLKICEKLKQIGSLAECWVDKKDPKKWQIGVKISQISKIKRISKPSCRVYYNLSQIQKNCLGKEKVWLISTSRDLLTNKEALKKKLGGEAIGVVSKKLPKT